jgi:hypothetical protein
MRRPDAAAAYVPATSLCGVKRLRGAVIYLTPMLQSTIIIHDHHDVKGHPPIGGCVAFNRS